MDKLEAHDWAMELEAHLDLLLHKWKKVSHMEDGEDIQYQWQFEHSHIFVQLFWRDDGEMMVLHCISPRSCLRQHWTGLNDRSKGKLLRYSTDFAEEATDPRRP